MLSTIFSSTCGQIDPCDAAPAAEPSQMLGSAQCVVSDAEDTAVNVRSSPNGKVINRLKNGRAVSVTFTATDSQERPWHFVEGWHNGRHRKWGYVFGELVDCN